MTEYEDDEYLDDAVGPAGPAGGATSSREAKVAGAEPPPRSNITRIVLGLVGLVLGLLVLNFGLNVMNQPPDAPSTSVPLPSRPAPSIAPSSGTSTRPSDGTAPNTIAPTRTTAVAPSPTTVIR